MQVPDLAFSELNFLNSRRERATDTEIAIPKKQNDKKMRDADADAEISRYFALRQGPERRHSSHDDKTYRRLSMPYSRQQKTPQKLIKIPRRSFLEIGNCGPNFTSPVKMVKELDARYVPSWSHRDTASPARATSYYTWSVSSPDRFRVAETGRIVNRASVEDQSHRKERISPTNTDGHEALADSDRVREQRLGAEETHRSSRCLNLGTQNIAKEQMLDRDSAENSQRQVSREKEASPKPSNNMRARNIHNEHAILEGPTSHDNIPVHRSPYPKKSEQLRTHQPSQGSFPPYDNNKQINEKNQGSASPTILEQAREQYLRLSISNTELDALLDQHATRPDVHPMKFINFQDRERDLVTQLKNSQDLHEVKLGPSITLSNAPAERDHGPSSAQRCRSLLSASKVSSRGFDRNSLNLVPFRQESHNLYRNMDSSFINKSAESQDTIIEGRNAWNGYNHLYDHQRDISGLVPENTIYEGILNNANAGQNLQAANNIATTSNQRLQNRHPIPIKIDIERTSDTYHNEYQESEAVSFDKYHSDHGDFHVSTDSPDFHFVNDLEYSYLKQGAGNSTVYTSFDGSHFPGNGEGFVNTSDVGRVIRTTDVGDSPYQRPPFPLFTTSNRSRPSLERLRGGMDVNGELKGFWTPNKLY